MSNSAQTQYTKEMKDRFGYHATWVPGIPIELGDIGIFRGDLFNVISSLSKHEIGFAIRPDNSPEDLEYSSKGAVSITLKISGSVPAGESQFKQGDAGIIVEFSKENATLFKANGITSPAILNTLDIGNKILELYKQGKWDKNWFVITEVMEAASATIIISNSANSKIELKANANIASSNIDIADGKFEFSTQFSRGLETKIIANSKLTPLFKIMGIKTRFLAPPVFKDHGILGRDLLTSDTAKSIYSDEIYFGLISDNSLE